MFLRNGEADAASQRHVCLIFKQPLAGHTHGDKRTGARTLDHNARPGKAKLVANARGKVVLVIAQQHVKKTGRRPRKEFASQAYQVCADGCAGINANGRCHFARHIARIFHRFPGAFKKKAVLRIHISGFPLADAEKIGIKHVYIIKNVACL